MNFFTGKVKINENDSYADVLLTLQSGQYETMETKVEWWQLKMLDIDWDSEAEPNGPREFDYLILLGFADKQFPSTFNLFTGGG